MRDNRTVVKARLELAMAEGQLLGAKFRLAELRADGADLDAIDDARFQCGRGIVCVGLAENWLARALRGKRGQHVY